MAYLKHHKALCGLFKTPQSALWLIQNTNKRFVVVIIITAILSVEAIVQTLLGQNWQRDRAILTGRLARFPHSPYLKGLIMHAICDWLFLFTIDVHLTIRLWARDFYRGGVNRFSDRRTDLALKSARIVDFCRKSEADSRIWKTLWIVDQL